MANSEHQAVEVKLRPADQAKALPLLARRYLSRAAYRLLEACRAFAPGLNGHSSYESIRQATGLRSSASIAKALKELEGLGIIEYRVSRDTEGQVAGLWVQYRGIPERISTDSLREYHRRVTNDLVKTEQLAEALRHEAKELEGEIRSEP